MSDLRVCDSVKSPVPLQRGLIRIDDDTLVVGNTSVYHVAARTLVTGALVSPSVPAVSAPIHLGGPFVARMDNQSGWTVMNVLTREIVGSFLQPMVHSLPVLERCESPYLLASTRVGVVHIAEWATGEVRSLPISPSNLPVCPFGPDRFFAYVERSVAVYDLTGLPRSWPTEESLPAASVSPLPIDGTWWLCRRLPTALQLWDGSPSPPTVPYRIFEDGWETCPLVPLANSDLLVLLPRHLLVLHLDSEERRVYYQGKLLYPSRLLEGGRNLLAIEMPYPEGDLLIASGGCLARCNWRSGQWFWTRQIEDTPIHGFVPVVKSSEIRLARFIQMATDPESYLSLLPRDILLLLLCAQRESTPPSVERVRTLTEEKEFMVAVSTGGSLQILAIAYARD